MTPEVPVPAAAVRQAAVVLVLYRDNRAGRGKRNNAPFVSFSQGARIPPVYYKYHCLRDPTRGGLATTLNELAKQSKVSIRIEEAKFPVR